MRALGTGESETGVGGDGMNNSPAVMVPIWCRGCREAPSIRRLQRTRYPATIGQRELDPKYRPMAETDTGSQTPSPLGNDPGERGGEHGLRGGTRAGGADPEDPGVDRNNRYLETSRGILSYAELAPLLAEKVTMAEAAIASGVYGDSKLDESVIQSLHYLVCGEFVPDWAGHWRDIEVKVGNHLPPPPHKIPILMRDYVLDLDARWDAASQTVSDLTLEFLAFAEGRFLTIHPFRDFNGRTVRLLLSECLRRLDLPLVALTPEGETARQEYFRALEAADAKDWSPLCEVWKRRLEG